MSEGKLKKRRVFVIDVFRDVNAKSIKGLKDRTSEMIFLCDIDEAIKKFPMLKMEALRLYDIFKDKPEEHRGSWIKLTFWAIEWLYGDSE